MKKQITLVLCGLLLFGTSYAQKGTITLEQIMEEL